MRGYATYISTLDALIKKTSGGLTCSELETIHPHLNGGAAAQLRSLVSRNQIRRSGAFFTGEELGQRLAETAGSNKEKETAAWDPNCGAGDLLLRWSDRLRVVDNDLKKTLCHWGQYLHGSDIHEEFLQVAKRRLTLAAISRGATLTTSKSLNFDHYFKKLSRKNLLKEAIDIPSSAAVLMNPPFTMIKTPKRSAEWASGNVAFAAVAFIDCLQAAGEGQTISAILPDVLRSGSRYERWRLLVAQYASSVTIHIVGRFSAHADVDVFILHAVATKSATTSAIDWFSAMPHFGLKTLGELFDVRVGTVVPHRHKPKGRRVAYLTTSSAPAWREIKKIGERLQYDGTCVTGPFLAIRRTSSPSDNTRAIATIVKRKQPTAVENHLISIRPIDESIETCRRLSSHLQSEEVRRWLDQRIRCRHLTVSALKAIPLSANFEANSRLIL